MNYDQYRVGQIQNAVTPMQAVSHPSEAIRADQRWAAPLVEMGTKALLTDKKDEGGANDLQADLMRLRENIGLIRQANEAGHLTSAQAERQRSQQLGRVMDKWIVDPNAVKTIKEYTSINKLDSDDGNRWQSHMERALEQAAAEDPLIRAQLQPTGRLKDDINNRAAIFRRLQLEDQYKNLLENQELTDKALAREQGLVNFQQGSVSHNQANIRFSQEQDAREIQKTQQQLISEYMNEVDSTVHTELANIDNIDAGFVPGLDPASVQDLEARRMALIDGVIQNIDQTRSKILATSHTFGDKTLITNQLNALEATRAIFISRVGNKDLTEVLTENSRYIDVSNLPIHLRGDASREILAQVQANRLLQDMANSDKNKLGIYDPNSGVVLKVRDAQGQLRDSSPASVAPFLTGYREALRSNKPFVEQHLTSLATTTTQIAELNRTKPEEQVVAFNMLNDVMEAVNTISENADPKVALKAQVDSVKALSSQNSLDLLKDLVLNPTGAFKSQESHVRKTVEINTRVASEQSAKANSIVLTGKVSAKLVGPDGMLVKDVRVADLIQMDYDKEKQRFVPAWREGVHPSTKSEMFQTFKDLESSVILYQDAFIVNSVISKNPQLVSKQNVDQEAGANIAIQHLFGLSYDRNVNKANEEVVDKLMTLGPVENLYGVSGLSSAAASVRTMNNPDPLVVSKEGETAPSTGRLIDLRSEAKKARDEELARKVRERNESSTK